MNKKNIIAKQTISKKRYEDKCYQNSSDYIQVQQQKKQRNIIKTYQHIIHSVQLNRQYCQIQMKKQIDKCNQYFASLANLIQFQKKKLINYISKFIQDIRNQYQTKIGNLNKKLSTIQNNKVKIFDELQQIQLKKHKMFQFKTFQIDFGNSVKEFQQELQKFIQVRKTSNTLQNSKSSSCNQSPQKFGANLQKTNQQDDIDKLTQICQNEFNLIEDLICDQSLNWQFQVKAYKQHKYKANVDEIIPEATQSKQNSIVLSNYQSVC